MPRVAWPNCGPSLFADMELGATHRGRVLKGRLVVEPLMMTSVQSMLEDSDGGTVMVCMYNMLPKSAERATLGERQRIAAQIAPEGSRVAIIEPFFKIFMDGNPGVRVDNPAEVVFLPDDEHLDAAKAVLDVDFDVIDASPSTPATRTPDVSAQAPLQRAAVEAASVSAGSDANGSGASAPEVPEGPAIAPAANSRGKGKPRKLRKQKESRKSKRKGKGVGFEAGLDGTDSRGSRGVDDERELAEGEFVGLVEMRKRNRQMSKMMQSPGARQKLKDMGLRGEAQMPDERVAPFHLEFEKEGRWPEGCNIRVWRLRLEEAYELDRSSPMHLMSVIASVVGLGLLDPMDVVMRLGGAEEGRLDWLLEADNGDVWFREAGSYDQTILHSFTNTPTYKVALTPGSVHVAVGFVDLGSLAAGVEAWGEQQEQPSAPLTWVGYEASPYVVAKTLVLLEMMRGGAETDAVLQVWYSAAWTRDTLAAFKSALQRLLPETKGASVAAGPSEPLPTRVLAFLRHWASAGEVPLAEARRQWMARSLEMDIANFQVKADRLALCGYWISGQLLGGELGSTVMCCLPRKSGEMAPNENFLQTFGPQELFDKRLKGEAQDIVEAGVQLARQRISRLSYLLQQKRVTAQVHLGTIGPESPSLLESIKALPVRPQTINWSNVPDYMDPRVFHIVARACSADEDTVHYMHSMNWVMDTKGASHIDFQMCDNGPRLEQEMEKLIRDARKHIKESYKAGGYEQLLLCPPIGNARNMADFHLEHTYHERWVDAFAYCSGLQQPQVTVLEPPGFFVLARAHSTMLLSLTYDPKRPGQRRHTCIQHSRTAARRRWYDDGCYEEDGFVYPAESGAD